MYGREIRVSRRVESSFFALFGGVAQPLHGLGIAAEVNPRFLFELLDEPVHDPAVEVIAAKLGVAVRGDDLENALADLEDGDVEGPAAEVVDEDFLFALFVEAVGQGRSGGLVDDAQDLKARDGSRVLRGLALEVVEVSGAGDDRFLIFVPKSSSASRLSFWRMKAEICSGVNSFTWPPISTRKRQSVPIRRFTERTVRVGLRMAWRLANCPTRISPFSVKATAEGVIRSPSALRRTSGLPPRTMAIQEFVVPRSMPTTFSFSLIAPHLLWGRG
jgi:hypothetical protein